jgi:hypothetical protein
MPSSKQRNLSSPESITNVVHPILSASTGLMEAALLAGMIPAMAAKASR